MKDKKQKKGEKRESLAFETKSSIVAIAFFSAAFFTVLAYIEKAGRAGVLALRALSILFGYGYLFVSFTLLMVGFAFLFPRPRPGRYVLTLIGGGIVVAAVLALGEIVLGYGIGGMLGRGVALPFLALFDYWASILLLAALCLSGMLITFNIPLLKKKELKEKENELMTAPNPSQPDVLAGIKEALFGLRESIEKKNQGSSVAGAESESVLTPSPGGPAAAGEPRDAADLLAREPASREPFKVVPAYNPPSLDLLEEDRGKPFSGDVKLNATLIQRTLQNFGIPVEMAEVSIGPSITQYTLKPAQGVKLSRIVALRSDLALALAAHPLRVEAPIPGKSLVGIEMPNRAIATVGLRRLLEHETYQKGGALVFALGKDVAGKPMFADLARMPHLLIAGSTGSGKSVAIHTLLMNLLFKNSPGLLRLLLIDPKRVELSVYHGVTHLLSPVITDAKRAIMSLRWTVKEMERRYDLLSESHSRDIAAFNMEVTKQNNSSRAFMPYIVIVIDELADLMARYGREMEASIVRLSQMARAVGIHLVVSTQRPSVDVITGLIKANITARVAFQVASHTNSQIILDTTGAETLLGNGDMLFLAGDGSKPRRIQGAFVSEAEVKRVIKAIRKQNPPHYEEELESGEEGESMGEPLGEGENDSLIDGDGDEDALYEEAKRHVREAGKASTSYLQRRLRIGYARAARLTDLLEERGIIGPADGAKPREILAKE